MTPAPPDWLSPAAREVWERTLDELEAAGRPAPDLDTLVVFCNAVVQHAEASKIIDRTNVLLKGTEGNLVRNPANAVAREAAATVTRLARQIGLSTPPEPPSRPRVGRRNTRGANETIAALRATGRLERVDAVTVAILRSAAGALDAIDPARYPAQYASLIRAQLATVRALRGGGDDDLGSAGLDELLAALGNTPLD